MTSGNIEFLRELESRQAFKFCSKHKIRRIWVWSEIAYKNPWFQPEFRFSPLPLRILGTFCSYSWY